MASISANCLLSDFDGTFTRCEFYDLAMQAGLVRASQDYWTAYAEKRMSHFEAISGIFSHLECSEAAMLDLVSRMEPDPKAPEALRELAQAGWDAVIVSNGCQWYIDIVLRSLGIPQSGLEFPVHACPGRFVDGQGLMMTAPDDSPYFRADFGVDKRLMVEDYQRRYERVAFAGNGSPDYQAALAVPPELRFARGWLARRFDQESIPYRPFEAWGEVAGALLAPVTRANAR
jgi:2-hydroxy-3-keto-5-methylthiopentenyl-1-phosphate phosphatase